MRLIAIALTVIMSGPALAQPGGQETPPQPTQGIEAYIATDAMQVMYTRNMDFGEIGRNDLRAGVLFNEDRDLVLIGDMLVDVGRPERRPKWALNVGPRVYGAQLNIENQDVFAVALGGELSYFLGRNRVTAVSLSAFYAPDIITFGNADEVTDIAIRFETNLTASTRIFVGYRSLEFNLPNLVREVDDGAHVGVRYRF
jgi:hypothetical protein